MTSHDVDEVLRLVRVGIESGLIRDGFPSNGLDHEAIAHVPVGWRPDRFAEDRARVILMSIAQEFEMRRRATEPEIQQADVRCGNCGESCIETVDGPYCVRCSR